MGSSYHGLPVRAVAVSAAVLSTAVALHFCGPSILMFASSEVPKIYGSLISWLTPPYLYFIINGIIISIAASSRFQKSRSDDEPIGSASGSAAPVTKHEYIVVSASAPVVEEEVKMGYAVPPEYATAAVERKAAEETKEEEEENFVSWTPAKRRDGVIGTAPEKETVTEKENLTEFSFPTTEKPLVSARLGRRKILKASPEAGKALGVSRSKRQDTLESTWKAITDGRAVPLVRHLKKSDTWETHHTRSSREDDDGPNPEQPLMRKSETFNERGGAARRPPASLPAGRLRKEPSVGQDDLNRRVEAFIKKFNEDMRLQRQESAQHYMDMINRGSH